MVCDLVIPKASNPDLIELSLAVLNKGGAIFTGSFVVHCAVWVGIGIASTYFANCSCTPQGDIYSLRLRSELPMHPRPLFAMVILLGCW